MRLTVVGCSGSYPGPDSPASCYLLEAEHDDGTGSRTWRVLLDLGSGALGALQRYADPLAVDAVLLSHLHADHCLDLCGYYVLRKYHPSGPQPRIERIQDQLDGLAARAERAGAIDIALGRERLTARIERIAAASPRSVLARGYSITRDARTGELIRSVHQVSDGQRVEIEVADGRFKARADDPRQPRLFE